MKYTFLAKDLASAVSEEELEFFKKKLSRFERIFGEDVDVSLKLSCIHHQYFAEVSVSANSVNFRAKGSSANSGSAVVAAIDMIETQIRKNKGRLAARFRSGGENSIRYFSDTSAEDAGDVICEVTKTKQVTATVMTREEAILQMNLLGHSFFIFADADNDDVVSVVYRRDDDCYGVIAIVR